MEAGTEDGEVAGMAAGMAAGEVAGMALGMAAGEVAGDTPGSDGDGEDISGKTFSQILNFNIIKLINKETSTHKICIN